VSDVTNVGGFGSLVDTLPPVRLPELPAGLDTVDLWSDSLVAGCGVEVRDVALVSVGGGIGSFVTVDYLRVAGGMSVDDIRVLSRLSHPCQTYQHLATVSQIPSHGRIRSDASSRPDNLWGFPSYAVQEALQERRLRPLLQVLVEPVFADFYTPRLRTVLASIEREATRIRYTQMLVRGNVQVVRRRLGGGYFTLLTPHPEQPPHPDRPLPAPIAYRSRDVHLAVGYPGLRFLPDLQRFRELYDLHHAVNAYEEHEHVYEALRRRPGTVLVRGAGIVASQVLERLIRDRVEGGAQTRILHMFRTYVAGAHGPHPWARRAGSDGFAYQGFNYPKSVWGGQLRARTHRLEGADRVRVYEEIGGTTTPWREHWQRLLEEGRTAGWYRTQVGTIEDLRLDQDTVVARLHPPNDAIELRVDYLIDCTGLDGDVAEHQVLRDLLDRGGAQRNPLGRLDVDQSFRLRGAESADGRVYVSGAAAYGGYFPGVDTFLGLQIAAQEIADDLARRGRCQRLGPLRSTVEWLKWATASQI
jgi:hypothetical protein